MSASSGNRRGRNRRPDRAADIGPHRDYGGHRDARNWDRGGRRGQFQDSRSHQRDLEGRPRPLGGIKFFTWDDLTQLSQSTPDQVVQAVLDNEAGFLKVFSHSKSCSNARILRSLIKIMYMLVKSQEKGLASRILGQIYSADGSYAQFCFQVEILIKRMPTHAESNRVENHNCLLYLLEIGLFGIQRIQKTMQDSFPKASIVNTIKALHDSGDDVRILQNKCEELERQFQMIQDQVRSQPIPMEQTTAHNLEEPPNDFTTIEVLPQNEDLKCGPKFKPFLRPNIITGRYQGWDHYLDIQFRLLREDFIAPLRDGIRSQYEGYTSRKSSEIRVYEHVHVLTPVCLFTGMGFEISFNVERFKRTNWEHSRRLIFGSLLCLSKNDFRDGSIIFATVVKRDAKQLEKGSLIIKFEGDVSGFHIDPSDEYTMVESTAYFEAYRHVLIGLQSASQLQDTMPFKCYIVECNMEHIPLPLHMRPTRSPCYNLSKVLELKPTEAHTMITDESSWPHLKTTCLDKSQYKALKMALRQEISVIQGPPGTGKTFIGLKLVQAFLYNRKAWDPLKNSPILVVCYTNHALDQFLEEIVDVYNKDQMTPPDIVRIGGRCKSEKLSNFVLARKVDTVRCDRALPGALHKRSRVARNEMTALKESFSKLQQELNFAEGKLLPLTILQSVMSDVHYFQISQGMPTQQGKEIEVWLKIWYPSEAVEALDTEVDDYTPQDKASAFQDENSSEDEFIAVDEEAAILQDERMLEGEEIVNENKDVPEFVGRPHVKHAQKRKVTSTEWQTVQIDDRERNRRIKKGFQCEPMREEDVQKIEDVRSLGNEQRWKLYHYWTRQYLKVKKQNLKVPALHYNEACRVYNDTKQEIDCYAARGTDIIAMTTTGASKHHHILKNIHPKIVVIEEAAEVFESHVITSLSPSVQQLILIGDHKQLRPKPNCYELEKKFNLDVSLFERLINNGIPHVTLEVQHRMRPDIASLICPTIYSDLENGPKAIEHGRHNIGGVGYNLFFIDHSFPEKQQKPDDLQSHVNIHEAEFMVSLCRYLLKQEYKPKQITLLTMYRGQLLEMKRRMKRTEFDGVRVAAVDDFQGEENDIILLSLVRSNSDGKIGFLKIENRICVSLSRARKGFYVIGNFSLLRSSDKSIWPQILSVVDGKKCIGKALPLQCQNHPNEKVLAMVAEDFSKCPEGGCTKICNFRLECGHACTRLCHPYDREHKLFQCQKRCNKKLSCRHQCRRRCYDCTNKCGPCLEMVEKTVQECGHIIELPCSQPPTKTMCTKKCPKLLPCGHFCQSRCSDPCSPQCFVKVNKLLPCGHKIDVACYLKPEEVVCSVPCDTLLQCLHPCEGTCGRCHQGRLHVHCASKCGRTLVCGHVCTFPCAEECPPCLKICKNFCPHSKCPKNCYEPCDPCAEPCEWNCVHLRCTKRCGEICNRPPCDEPCLKELPCGHPCIGLCGEKCPKLCRMCNREEVVEIFFGTEDEPEARFVELQDCNHIFEYTGLDHWMETEDEEIQFKKCPKCNTLIRTSLRYYNQIKSVHNDFEKIKKKQLDVSKDAPKLLRILQDVQSLRECQNCDEVQEDLKKIQSLLKPSSRPRYILPHCLSAIQNQLSILPNIAKIFSALANMKHKSCRFGEFRITTEMVNRDLECLQRFLMQESLTDQQLQDIKCEMKRVGCMFNLFELRFNIKPMKAIITHQDMSHLNELACCVYNSGAGRIPRLSEDLEEKVSELIAHFKKQYAVGGLTEAERIEIVKAVGLSKGHWFKCPNGHFYCIGECGGATQVAKCPECDAKIGGTNHALLAGNQLAPEMDGAQYAAWSTAANLANYNLRDLRLFNN